MRRKPISKSASRRSFKRTSGAHRANAMASTRSIFRGGLRF